MSNSQIRGPAKYKPAWAYVIYELDSKRNVVSITDIKDFNPVDQFSFDKEKSVQVLYRYKNEKLAPEYFAARILKLGLTKATLQKEVAMRRISAPKIFDEDKEDLSFVDLTTSTRARTKSDDKERASKKIELKKKIQDKKKTSLEVNAASLAAAKLSHNKRSRGEDDTSSDEEILVPKKHLKSLEKKSSANSKAIEDIKKRVRCLEKEKKKKDSDDQPATPYGKTTPTVVEETVVVTAHVVADPVVADPVVADPVVADDVVADPNVFNLKMERDDDEFMIPMLPTDTGNTEVEAAESNSLSAEPVQSTSSQSTVKAEASQASEEDKIPDILKNYVLPMLNATQRAKLATHSSNNSKWIKQLASYVFPPEVLAICSFSGAGSNRNKKSLVHYSLPEAGKKFMLDMFVKKLKDGGCSDPSILGAVEATVKSAVNEKCSSFRRPPKNAAKPSDDKK